MTSIEWLATYLKGITTLNCDEVIIQAKEMHNQEIVESVLYGMQKGLNINKVPETDSDWINNYYNETYGSKASEPKQ